MPNMQRPHKTVSMNEQVESRVLVHTKYLFIPGLAKIAENEDKIVRSTKLTAALRGVTQVFVLLCHLLACPIASVFGPKGISFWGSDCLSSSPLTLPSLAIHHAILFLLQSITEQLLIKYFYSYTYLLSQPYRECISCIVAQNTDRESMQLSMIAAAAGLQVHHFNAWPCTAYKYTTMNRYYRRHLTDQPCAGSNCQPCRGRQFVKDYHVARNS